MRVAVIGGGILGLTAARQVLLEAPDAEVVVLEKEPGLAAHQTGHNSGVVHAGIYYAPGSLKARLCRRGVGLLRGFCAERGLAYEECGKLVVATTPLEVDRLDAIHERAELNGVPGVHRLDGEAALRTIEPHVRGLAALHSPTTAIVDFAAVAQAVADEVRDRGGRIRTGAAVASVRAGGGRPGARTTVTLADGGTEIADRVLVCAGLQADRLARASGRSADPRIVPFRGEYWRLAPGRESLVRGLIYPVPDPSLPFLGVHLTRRIDGSVLVGPNAVLATAREGYRRRDLVARDLGEIAGWTGMRRVAVRYWRTGVAELARSASRRAFVHEARRYVPSLTAADVVRAPAGVRAQAVSASGGLVDDFSLDTAGDVVWVRNAPSPAATSSMAIAEELVGRLELSRAVR